MLLLHFRLPVFFWGGDSMMCQGKTVTFVCHIYIYMYILKLKLKFSI